ncbi:hypothetical protein LCGC14_1299190 [marine sediment metagenome]|uniref:Nicotinamide mononucleotide transporter PnuC n=1 Tax=marine sediment metagenome TaxID=412755 RepID=A0A0F9LAR7_9ZZZZ
MLDWIALGVTIIGYFLIIQYKHWMAFVIMIIADILWLVYYALRHEKSSVILMTIFVGIYLWGVVKWKKG